MDKQGYTAIGLRKPGNAQKNLLQEEYNTSLHKTLKQPLKKGSKK